MTIDGAHPLHQALYAAIAGGDAEAFNGLLNARFDELVAGFDAWTVVPDAIRADEAAVSRYVESLVLIARAVHAAGEPALLERLVGPEESNPLVQWQRRLRRAQALGDAGDYAASDRGLRDILSDMAGSSGSGVVNLQPVILGTLASNALRQGHHQVALDFTEQAYAASLAAADEQGEVAYYENLMALRVIRALRTEPERGQRVVAVRRLIARAQDAADAGRYRASVDALSAALSLVRGHPHDELLQALLPKIHGLLGFNQLELGNAAGARDHTARALEASKALRDADGVRVYTLNLTVMESSGR